MDAKQRQEIALFRYQVIAPLVTHTLDRLAYGRLLHELTLQEFQWGEAHTGCVGRRTIQRWVQAYHQHGLEGLEPVIRVDAGTTKAVPPCHPGSGRGAASRGAIR